MSKTLLIPFDKQTGALVGYDSALKHDQYEWRDNFEFNAVLYYDGYSRGRSAANIMWRDDESGLRYQMFLTDFDDAMKNAAVWKSYTDSPNNIGTVKMKGRWTFVKRGANYGVRYVGKQT